MSAHVATPGGRRPISLRLAALLIVALLIVVRLFDRPDETDGRRRLGVALATAPDPIVARDRARR